MNVDITFANFTSGTRHDSFLFAFPERDFERGEPTSDYLSFFGFGSGFLEGADKPNWLSPFWLFELPSIVVADDEIDRKDRGVKCIMDYKDRLREIATFYETKGIQLDREVIKRLFTTLTRMLDTPVTTWTLDTLTAAVLPTAYIDQKHYTFANTLLVAGVNRNNEFYLQLGLPFVEGIAQFNCYPLAGEKDRQVHNWKYASNVGGDHHTIEMIYALNRRKFTESHDARALVTLANKITKFYPHILI